MTVAAHDGRIAYESHRTHARSPEARLSVTYRSAGAPFQAVRGTLDYFLTERYCLYNLNHRGVPYRLDIHHPPWPLQRADAEFARNTMAVAASLSPAAMPPLLHFAKRQDIVAWAPTTL